ncbi:hypothetical protein F4779DRAFT_563429 [Xylariaceae sp. FL0662B]|nr:hypothetical protein F4779DRAFT_563429 [Xylariaceae sp. FL0662B]
MNSHNLKRRRPYGYEDAPAVPAPQDLSLSLSTSAAISGSESLSTQDLHIIRQAASILNCPVSQLLVLHRSSHLRQHSDVSNQVPTKRPRFHTDMISESSQEKSSRSRPSVHDNAERQRPQAASDHGFSLGIEGSRLGHYLANFSVCPPCTTCEPQDYGAITAAYSYPESQPYFDRSSLPPSNSMPGSMPPSQPNDFVCHGPPVAPPMMPNYPILQPSRPMTIQPTTSGEGMIYPESLPGQQYFGQSDLHHGSPTSMTSHMMATQCYSPPSFENPGVHARQYSMARNATAQEVDRTQIAGQSHELDIVHANQRPPPSKRGPFKSNDEREKTAETRRIGSCIRCRMQRIRCETNPLDKYGTCLTCLKVSSVKIWRMPCLRYKITDVKLFKPGQVKGYEWTRRWVEGIADDISQWASPETRTVQVSEGYTEQPVELRVRQFVPQDGDALDRTWVHDGARRVARIPAYAIVNLEEAKGAYSNYIKQGLPECCKKILSRKEKLLLATYAAAIKASRDQSIDPKEAILLTKALQLWMAIRMTTKSTIIVGKETLGMSHDIMDETSPLRGCIPLPPVMGAQIELVLIHQIQSSLRREMLENLQAMTQANKHQSWFTTYLITFILLHNVALLCQHDAAYAQKHGIKVCIQFVGWVHDCHLCPK